jgi:hypothetical protein
MAGRTQDRLFAGCGIASAVLVHVGLFVGVASGQAFVNLGSSPEKVTRALANPAGTGVWVGAYLDLLGFAAFLAFAPWASAKLGGGLLGAVARAAGASYAALGIAAWCVLDAVEFPPGTAWERSWQLRSPTSTRPSTSAAGSSRPSSCSPSAPSP